MNKNKRTCCKENLSSNHEDDSRSNREVRIKILIQKEIEEFRKAKTREEKQKIMIKRRNDNLTYHKDLLLKRYEKYFKKYFPLKDVDFNNINPLIIFCDTKEQKEMWTYFRHVVSSLTFTGYYGRSIKYFLIDKKSGCVLGIVGIGSDFMSLSSRDNYIGWNKENKFGKTVDKYGKLYDKPTKTWKNMKELGLKKVDNKINNLMNIFVCISTFPFNELLMGKLLTISVFSNEVLNKFKKTYNQKLVGITTTSIYGKSIQYDRLTNYIKMVGISKGIGTVQFSKSTIELIRKYYIDYSDENNWKKMDDLGLQPKAKMIQIVCKKLGFNNKILNHNHKRGIYFGYTHKNSKDFLTGKIQEQDLTRFSNRNFNNLVKYWKKRWFVKRIEKAKTLHKNKYLDYYNLFLKNLENKI